MTYNATDNVYTLACSGRTFYANNGILGLSAFEDGLTQGYDGGVQIEPYDDEHEYFTLKERKEIAEHMIEAWRDWAEHGT